ncbi:MAG: PH domain-containing protein, partial [Propionibacteriaceae bacterium]|nr:PH domain-containing protein [Propionibacteriaceae bacterium]
MSGERRPSLLTPQVERYLLADQGEVVVDQVLKHPVTLVGPVSFVVAGCGLMLWSLSLSVIPGLVLLIGLGLALSGLYRYHRQFMDRFVITNMRVFRVHGIFFRQVAT